ncbi:hypothetical protein C8R46DRAFT_1218273 [Mycena filopes]|nr:hypothetical protein C8R46DRAFT_1218273 [Mycena filopes]
MTFDDVSPPAYSLEDTGIHLNHETPLSFDEDPPPAYTARAGPGVSTDLNEATASPATTTTPAVAVALPPTRVRRVLAGIRSMAHRAWRVIVTARQYEENYPMVRLLAHFLSPLKLT